MVADRGPVTSAVTITFVVLATTFVSARFFTRVFLVRSIKQEDWWILAAWIVAVGFSASICIGVHYGLGLHGRDIGSVARHEALRKVEYAFSVLYNPSLLLTKTSIIVFFLNVMSKDVDPIFKWCNCLTLALVNIAGVALTFLNIFQCTPIRSTFLYPTPENAHCTDVVTLYLSSAPVNIITDLAIIFLPMPILTGMRLQRKQKIILIVTFGFGVFVAAVDVVRIAYLQNASVARLAAAGSGSNQSVRTREEGDFPWVASFSFMWSAVEVNLGIICASVPMLKPLFTRFMPILVHDSESRSSPSAMTDDPVSKVPSDTSPDKGILSAFKNPAASRRPAATEYTGDDDGDTMGFLNMLNETGFSSLALKSVTTKISRTNTRTTARIASNFDFVRIDKTRNMLELSNRKSLKPLTVVILIFLLWGTAYGFLDTLNAKFESVADVGRRQALGLHAAYFGGYLVGPLTLGQYILRRYGFKASMMAGLCVYGCGTLTFWPSAVLTSYPAFMISNFIVGSGLSCLEIAANPYIALCGPFEYAEARLCFAQGFQTIGTIVAPLLAQKVLFTGTKATALVDVQWAYLGIAFFVIGLAVAFYYIQLPEASDEQLQALADRQVTAYGGHTGSHRVIWWTLVLGVFSQWTYVGGQEVIRGTSQPLYDTINTTRRHRSSLTPFDFQTVSYTVYMTGRFLSGFATYFLQPRKVLLLLYTGLIVCCALQMVIDDTGALVLNQFIYLCESGIFSLIFAIALRGMGKYTKVASALLTAAISGGAIFPVVQWATQSCCGLKFSFVVPLVVFAAGWVFPVYLNAFPAARAWVDPTREGQGDRWPPDETQGGRSGGGTADTSSMAGGLPPGDTAVGNRQAKMAFASEPMVQHIEKLVQLRQPSGIVGELLPWPGPSDELKIESIQTSGGDTDVIAQRDNAVQKPSIANEDGEEEDLDYYTYLRKR